MNDALIHARLMLATQCSIVQSRVHRARPSTVHHLITLRLARRLYNFATDVD